MVLKVVTGKILETLELWPWPSPAVPFWSPGKVFSASPVIDRIWPAVVKDLFKITIIFQITFVFICYRKRGDGSKKKVGRLWN